MSNDKEFIRSVLYYCRYKDDVTRLTDWDEEICKQLMPAFYKAWKDCQIADEVLNRVMLTYGDDE